MKKLLAFAVSLLAVASYGAYPSLNSDNSFSADNTFSVANTNYLTSSGADYSGFNGLWKWQGAYYENQADTNSWLVYINPNWGVFKVGDGYHFTNNGATPFSPFGKTFRGTNPPPVFSYTFTNELKITKDYIGSTTGDTRPIDIDTNALVITDNSQGLAGRYVWTVCASGYMKPEAAGSCDTGATGGIDTGNVRDGTGTTTATNLLGDTIPIVGGSTCNYVDGSGSFVVRWGTQVTAATINGAPQPKIYKALLTQTGTDAPTATVLVNTLGGTPVWSYNGTGNYTLTLAGAFGSKANAMMQPWYSSDNGSINDFVIRDKTADSFNFWAWSRVDSGTVDGLLNNNLLIIEVYP